MIEKITVLRSPSWFACGAQAMAEALEGLLRARKIDLIDAVPRSTLEEVIPLLETAVAVLKGSEDEAKKNISAIVTYSLPYAPKTLAGAIRKIEKFIEFLKTVNELPRHFTKSELMTIRELCDFFRTMEKIGKEVAVFERIVSWQWEKGRILFWADQAMGR